MPIEMPVRIKMMADDGISSRFLVPSKRGFIAASWAMAAFLVASSAQGDGVCYRGYRETTADERATMTAVLEAVKGALPPAPEGWVVLGDDALSITENICGDYAIIPWQYEFGRSYQRVDDQEARQQKLEAAGELMRADMAAKQPRLDAITARSQVLGAELGAAAEKGDYARADEINQEIFAGSEEYKRILDEGDATERMNALYAEMNQDLQMSVRASINPLTASPPAEGASAIDVPAGATSAFRWSTTSGDVQEDQLVIFFGEWRTTPEGFLTTVRPEGSANLVEPRTIMVQVTAHAGRIAGIVDAINFEALASTLAK
jgi:hypothetical protein